MKPVVANATKALLGSIVDYAGTFPPAGLGVHDALSRYSQAKDTDDGWMLGCFVLPVSRLREFERFAEQPDTQGATRRCWPLSVITSGEAAEMEEVARFREAWDGRAEVLALECRPLEVAAISEAARSLPSGMEIFFEAPFDADFEARVSEIARLGANVKIRTGGVVADAVPSAADLARVLVSCAAAGVAFKASAGLHHALRGSYALTYDADSSNGHMHGFLNLCLAVAMARAGDPISDVVAALNETAADAFSFDDQRLMWRGHAFSAMELADLRRHVFRSFNSCSFVEPVMELKEMSLI